MSSDSSQLLYAIMNDDTDSVQRQVRMMTFQISSEDSWMVYEACLKGPQMIAALASAANVDMNPELPSQKGDRVFHMLLRTPAKYFKYGEVETIEALCKTGIDPFLPGRGGDTAIHILCGCGALARSSSGHILLQALLFGDLPSRCHNSITNKANIAHNTALIIAAQHQNLPQVELLLRNGADPNARGEFRRTALFFAVARNFTDIARELLRYGANVGTDIVALSPEMEALLSA